MEKSSRIITLTTDWGDSDYYAGAVKGNIYRNFPDAVVVDITHNIEPFNIIHAAYILKNSFSTFPKGTVHIIGVDSEDFAVKSNIQSHIAVSYQGHYFIGADNGVFSMMMEKEKVDKIIELTIPFQSVNGKVRFTFSCRDRFVNAAAHLIKGGDISKLGKPTEEWKELLTFNPSYGKDFIKGVVIYVDHYENAITNISEDLFEKVVSGRQFILSFKNNKIDKISKLYSDATDVKPLALFNGAGLLEIALNRANASGLLGLRKNGPVMIEVSD